MSRQAQLQGVVRDALAERAGRAFVLVGSGSKPAIRYCLSDLDSDSSPNRNALERDATYAVALDGESVLECGPSTDDDDRHPAERLANRLVERGGFGSTEPGPEPEPEPGTLLTPRTIPHDAALYLEGSGFSLSSSDCLERARERKTPRERDRIERAQTAATAGLERARELLAEAAVGGSDRARERELAFDGDPLTPDRLRIGIDEAIVRAGGFPAGNTVVRVGTGESRSAPDVALRAGEPITLETAPHDPNEYYGGLARTVVVDGDGGWERRAHVAVTHAFKSAASLLSTDGPTVHAVEADLAAEVRAFGFEDGIETSVRGVGLEPRERPLPGDEIGEDCVLRLEAAVVGADGGQVRLADCLERTASGSEGGPTVEWLPRPSQSLEASVSVLE